ncbi:MAG: Coenzyme A biosynthesis bifunctional protein CoaBC [Phycisphaerae bacterium]|nr:Coenzyme A biosynthesis bifunctional protein CoaBC [Phycisphaerae bacterium]
MRILITAGPTREHLDPVRYLSNASTGRMGVALAEAAIARGHGVVLVCGPVEAPLPSGAEIRRVTSAHEMLAACLDAFRGCDAAVMAAAVCDYRPLSRQDRKMHRKGAGLTLELAPTEDICARLGAIKGRRVVVGFALEDESGGAKVRAAEKRASKHCDAIVLNALSNIGADAGQCEILLEQGGWQPAAHGAKRQLADEIMTVVERLASREFDRS